MRALATGYEVAGLPAAVDPILVHAAVTWALVGLIWVVQLVQYPGFAAVGPREFAEYHAAHCRRITRVVGPLMGLELVTLFYVLSAPPASASALVLWGGAALLAVNWLCTVLVSVPLHARITGRGRVAAQTRLVATNWIRTVAWTLRGVLVLGLLG